MKQIIVILTALLFFSCGNEPTHDFTLKGSVKGLKKGTVYLQRQNDLVMETIDSLQVNGSPNFELHAILGEPEILFLKLDKNDNDEVSDAIDPTTSEDSVKDEHTCLAIALDSLKKMHRWE